MKFTEDQRFIPGTVYNVASTRLKHRRVAKRIFASVINFSRRIYPGGDLRGADEVLWKS